MSNYGAALEITLMFTVNGVKSDIIQLRVIVIVTNYTDISRKMNYNRNRQFGRLIRNIISFYVRSYVQYNSSCYLVVCVTTRPLVFVAYRKGLGYESHRCR